MITTLEEAHEIIHESRVSPDMFWPSVGYDYELVQKLAMLGSVTAALRGVEVDPNFVMAAMQMGAALALGAPQSGAVLGVEI